MGMEITHTKIEQMNLIYRSNEIISNPHNYRFSFKSNENNGYTIPLAP